MPLSTCRTVCMPCSGVHKQHEWSHHPQLQHLQQHGCQCCLVSVALPARVDLLLQQACIPCLQLMFPKHQPAAVYDWVNVNAAVISHCLCLTWYARPSDKHAGVIWLCSVVCRTYTYTVRGNATGNLTNLVLLTRVDTNTSNNNATSTVTVLGTCGNPFGNDTKLSCPPGNALNSSRNGTTITSLAQFNTTCCVSVLAGVCWCWSGATRSELCVECQ